MKAAARVVLLFKPEFAPAVRAGIKNCTIRPKRKRPIRPGAIASLREWSGRPYASRQRLLREDVPVKAVSNIFVGQLIVIVDGQSLSDPDAEALARADGFGNAEAMRQFLRKTHGLPFSGDLIQWAAP